MIANRRKLGTTSRNSSRLPAASGHCIDRPVMLPPGRARLATRPAPSGPPDNARTIYHAFACGASMKGLAFKAPSGVILHPQPKVPRGILEPRSAGARTHALGGVLIDAQTAR